MPEKKGTQIHMKRKGKTLTIVIAITAAVISLSVFARLKNRSAKDTAVQTEIPVEIEKPQYRVMEKILSFTGNLVSGNTVTVLSKIPGKIEKIYVTEGAKIYKGELLAKIEDDSVILQMKQAYSAWKASEAQYNKIRKGARKEEIENTRALVKQAKQDLVDAEENLNRLKRLYKNGAIPKSQYEESESRYRNAKTSYQNAQRSLSLMEKGASPEELEMARANMDAMKAQYELACLQVDYTRITAPISGKVAKIFADKGNMVAQTTPILTIISESLIEAQILIPEKYYGEIKEKKDSIIVNIYPSAYTSSKPYTGKISAVDSVIDPASRTFTVSVDIENRDGSLLPGMFIEADLVIEHYDNALTVPIGAVVNSNGREGVFIVKESAVSPKNGEGKDKINRKVQVKAEDAQKDKLKGLKLSTAQFIAVKTGIRESGRVQILKGISASDLVIIDGNSFLENGQEVRIISGK
ncbi:MAG: hypothetical protein DRP57_01295 [Spirochaetes bacterium]|nr:MAG: hypothetical protein DRP57_01295 [Spirochaetota bacterium]